MSRTTTPTPPRSTANPEDVSLIVHANHWDPFQILGQHESPTHR